MIVENPFVTPEELREALDPAGRSPVTAVRRLREAGLISHGVQLRPHHGGRLRGGAVYYCALNLDAADAVRDGDEVTARKLAQAATSVETGDAARTLAMTLSITRDLRELPGEDRKAIAKLARRISDVRNQMVHGPTPLVGLVIDMNERYGTVRTDDETVVLPRETLHARGLDWIGAAVAIRVHQLRTGAMLHSVDEAFALDDDDRQGARTFDPFAMRAERRGTGAASRLENALAGREPVRVLAPLTIAG